MTSEVRYGSKADLLDEAGLGPLRGQQRTSSNRNFDFANKPVFAPVKANFPLLLDDHLFDDTATKSLSRRFVRDWTARLRPA
jgi:hypothetical protein